MYTRQKKKIVSYLQARCVDLSRNTKGNTVHITKSSVLGVEIS